MSEVAVQRAEKNQRRRKVQAVLAGGLVLGIGAAVTLAAWNDSEFAQGIFSAGSFNLQGSTDGDTYTEHPTVDEAATLSFSADNMTPGETTYAELSVRLDADTTVAGTIEAADGIAIVESDGPNVDHLSYSVYADPDSCDSSGTAAATAVASGEDLSEGVGSNSDIPLSIGEDGEAGDAVLLCFAVTADTVELQRGGAADATWEITATSDEG